MDRLELGVMRAEQAAQIIKNPLFEQAFGDTRQAILEAIAALPDVRGEQASDLHRMAKLLDRVKRCLEVHIETGKLAQKEIEGRKSLFDLRRRA